MLNKICNLLIEGLVSKLPVLLETSIVQYGGKYRLEKNIYVESKTEKIAKDKVFKHGLDAATEVPPWSDWMFCIDTFLHFDYWKVSLILIIYVGLGASFCK